MDLSIAGWLPVDWPKAVLPVAIESGNGFIPVGTAFLIDYKGLNTLVTAKHVVFDEKGKRTPKRYVLSNNISGGAIYFPLDQLASQFGLSWKTLGSHDIAATVLLPDDSKSADIKKFDADIFESLANIREGDDIFLLGFPLSLGISGARVTPLVRTGIVALRNDDRSFLVDANVFPGSSGSPVFLKPSPFEFDSSGLRLGSLRPPKLIGIVTEYRAYTDEAVSQQTGKTRVIFEENSGLGSALSAEIIRELLDSSDFQDMAKVAAEKQHIQ